MKQTIKEIKAHLTQLQSIKAIQQQAYFMDKRIGVQKAIATRIKQLDKAQHLVEQNDEMSYNETQICDEDNYAFVYCIDEVVKGPLAGPVVVCAFILNSGHQLTGLYDSNQLSSKKRKMLESQLLKDLYAYAFG